MRSMCVVTQTVFIMLQDHFEQAVACSYETVLLGHRSRQPQLIATSTVNVGKAGQRYIEMLAEVVARLVKDGHGRAAAKVSMHIMLRQPPVFPSTPVAFLPDVVCFC